MKNLFLIICTTLFMFDCSNRTDENSVAKNNIDAAIYVYLNSSEGSNLVGTNNFSSQTINVKYVEPASSNKNFYYIDSDLQGRKFIKILLNTGLDNSMENVSTETVVNWNNNATNTFRADVKKVKGETENSIWVDKVYLDGQLVCQDKDHRTITIVK